MSDFTESPATTATPPGPPSAGYRAATHAPHTYEFNEFEDRAIAELATNMRHCALVAIIFGALGTFGSVGAVIRLGLSNLPQLALSAGLLAQGIFMLGASTRFDLIVTTKGSDIANLLLALSRLQRFYLVMVAAAVVDALVTLIALVRFVSIVR
jgi:hypothetical protein